MTTDTTDKTAAPDVAFLNQEQRTPVAFLFDVSGSVEGAPVAELNAALPVLAQDLKNDPIAQNRVELAIITFGDDQVTLVQDFTTVNEFIPPTLTAGGNTPLGKAINEGLDKIAERKQRYKDHGIEYTRPWLFIVTDAQSTDDVTEATERLHRAAAAKSVDVFAVGFGNVDMIALARIAPPERPPLRLQGLKFRELFQWASKSVRRVSTSKTGTQVSLPPTDTWATTTA